MKMKIVTRPIMTEGRIPKMSKKKIIVLSVSAVIAAAGAVLAVLRHKGIV